MAVARSYIEMLIIGVFFFRSHGVLNSQHSFPSRFRTRLWVTSSGVAVADVFAAEAHGIHGGGLIS